MVTPMNGFCGLYYVRMLKPQTTHEWLETMALKPPMVNATIMVRSKLPIKSYIHRE